MVTHSDSSPACTRGLGIAAFLVDLARTSSSAMQKTMQDVQCMERADVMDSSSGKVALLSL